MEKAVKLIEDYHSALNKIKEEDERFSKMRTDVVLAEFYFPFIQKELTDRYIKIKQDLEDKINLIKLKLENYLKEIKFEDVITLARKYPARKEERLKKDILLDDLAETMKSIRDHIKK